MEEILIILVIAILAALYFFKTTMELIKPLITLAIIIVALYAVFNHYQGPEIIGQAITNAQEGINQTIKQIIP